MLSAGLVPPLIVGYVELDPGFAGSGLRAVPDSVALSLIVLPTTHGPRLIVGNSWIFVLRDPL